LIFSLLAIFTLLLRFKKNKYDIKNNKEGID